jgi:hypothetical protein
MSTKRRAALGGHISVASEVIGSAGKLMGVKRLAQLTEQRFKMDQTTRNAPRQILISYIGRV